MVTALLIGGALGLDVGHGDAQVMEPVAPLIDGLLVDRAMFVLGLNELDHHVAGDALQARLGTGSPAGPVARGPRHYARAAEGRYNPHPAARNGWREENG